MFVDAQAKILGAWPILSSYPRFPIFPHSKKSISVGVANRPEWWEFGAWLAPMGRMVRIQNDSGVILSRTRQILHAFFFTMVKTDILATARNLDRISTWVLKNPLLRDGLRWVDSKMSVFWSRTPHSTGRPNSILAKLTAGLPPTKNAPTPGFSVVVDRTNRGLSIPPGSVTISRFRT